MSRVKIGYFADGQWAHNAFQKIYNDKDFEIMFICVRYDTNDDILRNLALQNGIDYLKFQNINSELALSQIKRYECDLFISMSFNQIFKSEIINLPKLKTINCHAGKLPFYRGRNVLNWALINDEKNFGITVHYVDEGIDTGDIILQNLYPITDEDNYSSLLDLAYVECANTLYNAMILIKGDQVRRIKQSAIHPVGFYCGLRKVGDEIINWNQTSREIFNFIRAISHPGPKGQTSLNGTQMKINKVKMIKESVEYKGIPGQIVGIINGMPVVKTKDTILIILEYEFDGNIRIGDRLK